MRQIAECAWAGLQITTHLLAGFTGVIVGLIFVTWGFAEHPYWPFVVLRMLGGFWACATVVICARKRGWLS